MKNSQYIKNQLKRRRQIKVRAKIVGLTSRLRLNVFRSLSHIYAQIIDDGAGKTLVAASDLGVKDKKKLKKIEVAFKIGELLAQKANQVGIKTVVFDRAGYRYHGRVKALADGARKGGLQF